MHPNLDPELRAALAARPLPPRIDFSALTSEELRELRRLRRDVAAPSHPDVLVEDRIIPGAGVRVRIYRPRSGGTGLPASIGSTVAG